MNDPILACYPSKTNIQKNILSVDGGGVRAVIPLGILREITQRTGWAVHEIFDGFVGTSSGALMLNALLLPGDKKGAKFTPAELYENFDTDIPKIFKDTILDDVESGFSLLKPKYRPDALQSFVHELAGEALFKDQIRDICVPSFNLLSAKPIVFRRDEVRTQVEKSTLKVYDVVLASGAAPTYFPAHDMVLGEKKLSMVDGGIYANNPASWSKTLLNEGEDAFLLSLGTGMPPYSFAADCVYEEGTLAWLPKLPDLFFAATIGGSAKLAKKEFKKYKSAKLAKKEFKKYKRLNPKIGANHYRLDDASLENIKYLKNTNEEYIKDHDEDINIVCRNLLHNRIQESS